MKKQEIKKLSKDQIIKNIDKFKKDLFNFRFQKMNSQITNPAKISETRKTIARYSHPLLKKVIKVRKKYNAHDENNKFKTGDKVSIIESKPFSKNKKFQVMENTK